MVGAPMPMTVPSLGATLKHRQEAAGAGLILRHDRGLSGNVLAEMAGEQPPESVVAAAGRVADDEIDGLAGVELFRRLRRSFGPQASGKQDRDEARA
jgi:hypothetical protein